MDLAKIVYEVLRSSPSPPSWMDQAIPHEDGDTAAFLRESNLAMRGTIQKYLKGCFKERFMASEPIEDGPYTEPIDGFLQMGDVTFLVEVLPVSNELFTSIRDIAPSVLGVIAAKARAAGVEDAILLLYNRNNSSWVSYDVTGDFDGAYQQVRHFLSGGPPPRPRVVAKVNTQITQEIDRYLYSLNFVDSGRHKKCIHPSEISTTDCDRKVAYSLIGQEAKESISPGLRRIFNAGHAYHDVIQGSLSMALGDRFRAEVSFNDPGLRIRGSCDGDIDRQRGIEIKSINDKGHKALRKPKDDHKEQATIYAVELSLSEVDYFYANKETGQLSTYLVPTDRKLWQSIAARITRIIRAVDAGILPDKIPQDYPCAECKYAWTCKPQVARFR